MQIQKIKENSKTYVLRKVKTLIEEGEVGLTVSSGDAENMMVQGRKNKGNNACKDIIFNSTSQFKRGILVTTTNDITMETKK